MPACSASMTASAPAGFFSKNFLNEKGIEHATLSDTKRPRPVPAVGSTGPYSTSSGTFPAIGPGCAYSRAALSSQSASAGAMIHRARTTGRDTQPQHHPDISWLAQSWTRFNMTEDN